MDNNIEMSEPDHKIYFHLTIDIYKFYCHAIILHKKATLILQIHHIIRRLSICLLSPRY